MQRVLFDELAARFDDIAHQRREDLVGGDRVLDAHLEQAARFRIDRGFPQLLGIHFAQALEALDLATLLRFFHQPCVRIGEARDRLRAIAADDLRAFAHQAVQQLRDFAHRAQLAGFERGDRQDLHDLLAHVRAVHGDARRGAIRWPVCSSRR